MKPGIQGCQGSSSFQGRVAERELTEVPLFSIQLSTDQFTHVKNCPGKEPLRIRGNNRQSLHRARNSAYSHQPERKVL